MSLTINNVANKYMYTNSKTGQTRLNLDTSADGVWSKQEVKNYAADFEAVTGKAVDVDAVFDTYDADKSGTLDYSEYDKAISEDALGIADLESLKAAAEAALAEITATDEDGTNSSVDELLSSMNLDASEVAKLIGSDEAEEVEETEATEDTEETEAAEETDAEAETEESSEPTTLAEYMASLTDAERLSWIKATYKAESTTSLIQSMLDPDAALSNLNSLISQYGNTGLQSSLSSSLDTLA